MNFLKVAKILGLSVPLFLSAGVYAKENNMMQEQKFLVGTWTGTPENLSSAFASQGIYTVKLNKDGTLLPINEFKLAHPSWIALSKNNKFAYVTNETEQGNVTALRVKANGQLELLNTVKSLGDHPTHASVSADGKYVFVANYSVEPNNAGISVFAIKKDGALTESIQNIPFIAGSGVVADRQKSGHAHSVTVSPDGKHVFVADLGADIVRAYDYMPTQKEPLKANSQLDLHFPKGSGPRHVLFSNSGKFAYVTSEMDAKVTVFEKKQNQYVMVQNESLSAKDHEDHKSASGLVFSPDGKFLYVGNRKKINEIVAYSINAQTGQLSLVGRYSSGGVEPRAFAIDHSGNYMMVSNVFTHTVSEFKRDKKTGALTPTRIALQVGQPTDIKFLP